MTDKIDALFINVPSSFNAYAGSKLHAGMQIYPLLAYANLAAVLREKGAKVRILDLGLDGTFDKLVPTLKETQPRFIGVTCTTPLFHEAAEISRVARKMFGKDVLLVIGGPHASALPEEALKESEFDIAVIGEGEIAIAEIWDGNPWSGINGIYYKENGKITATPQRDLIKDLDSLPMPALDLYDTQYYMCSKSFSRESPVTNLETSRGCPAKCSFCNKNISGRKYRVKSARRVVDEIKMMLKLGYKEMRVIDDQFCADKKHARETCELILKENLKFPWSLAAGIRVNNADLELFKLAKKAGCYQMGIGFESGDQASLDSIDKDIKLEQSIRCMEIVKKAGIESIGFFMFGLPADTEESMNKTIKFAKRLMPDLAKVTITMPFPGTKLFDQYEKAGAIKTRDWRMYNFHRAGDIYTHPHLSFETMTKYYNRFYREFYLSPRYLANRLVKSIARFRVHRDFYYFLQTFFPKLMPHKKA
ncbi:MAG: hypothetical protein A2297_07380 [Elusimicrobia bacterium RIFOXYB2_FULL_48_7]|nr:MAG: hypothetical protein A2297_07380 [Elusimicrobia bacterium RIFOXYB2_FULL_48_7]